MILNCSLKKKSIIYLKWNEHINRACSMAYVKLGILRRTFRTWKNARMFKLLFTTFVRPRLEYAAPFWNSLDKKESKNRKSARKSNKNGSSTEKSKLRRTASKFRSKFSGRKKKKRRYDSNV